MTIDESTTELPQTVAVPRFGTVIDDSGDASFTKRILIGVPSTGSVRMEWVQKRYGQTIPVNWSQVEMVQWLDGYIPMRYQVADAQNLIVQAALDNGFEWVLLYEHDVLPPPHTFIMLNEYMRERKAPIVSGLYYTRSRPSEPLVFRGRGNSVYLDWEMGDLIWCDGVPTGMLLIDCAILRLMYDESPEYLIKRGEQHILCRRVFETPRRLNIDPMGNQNALNGTSDLDWSTRVIQGDYIRRAGWNSFLDSLDNPAYPLLIDTRIFCRHINPDGEQFP